MQQKLSPAVIGVVFVILIAFCAFMYVRANSSQSPQQLPPPSGTFKPGYSSPSVGSRHYNNAAPNAQGSTSGAQGGSH